jgi:hypothetical protein
LARTMAFSRCAQFCAHHREHGNLSTLLQRQLPLEFPDILPDTGETVEVANDLSSRKDW